LGLALAVIILLLAAAPGHGQTPSPQSSSADEPNCDSPEFGFLTIYANQSGSVEYSLSFCFAPEREVEMRQKLPAVLGCSSSQMDFLNYKDRAMAGLGAACEKSIPRHGLRFSEQLNPSPIRDLLKSAGVDSLSINISIPLNGTARCDPEPEEESDSQTARECAYLLKGPAGDAPVIHFSFGYDTSILVRIATILGFLLLLPILLTLWIRHRALNAPEEAKAEVCFAYFKSLKW
jgi:hypothetical protein